MLNGVFALLERSLRIDARGWTTHLCRLGLAGAIYFSLCFALSTQNMFGAPGLRFLEGIAFLDVTFATLLGLGYFSSIVTEEKEEDTLGLMLMAGISPLGILIGKTGGRLIQAVLLVAVQYPFMQLAVTMGGVSGSQVSAVIVAMTTYVAFLTGFGVLCSTIAPRTRTSATLMILGLLAYLLVPSLARWLVWMHSRWIISGGGELSLPPSVWTFLKELGDVCVFLRMGDILTTGFGESPWSIQAVSNSIAGLVCFAISWMVFGLVSRSPATESSSRGLVSRQRGFFRFHAGRPGINPFLWKDFHFASGGIGSMLVRVVYYGGFFIAGLIGDALYDSPQYCPWTEGCLLLMSFSVAVDAAMVLARSIHDEIRGQTLASLMMLPRSSNHMIVSKFAGALIAWLPGPIFELALTVLTPSGRHDLWWLYFREPCSGIALTLLFAMIPHFSVIAATYLRWGAVPLGIGLSVGVYFLIIAGIVTVGGPEENFFAVVAFLMSCVCLGCILGVLLRFQSLGAR